MAPRKDLDISTFAEPDDVILGKKENPGSNDIALVVMGPMGAGKSSFINNILDSYGSSLARAKVTDNFASCTRKVQHYIVELPVEKGRSRRRLILLDTPGLDDADGQDSGINALRPIATWLASAYTHNVKLGGLIYVFPVFPDRMTRAHQGNIKVFSKLCGTAALSRVYLAMTRWSMCKHEATAVMRKQELHRKFCDNLDGARDVTSIILDDTSSSARDAVVRILHGADEQREKVVMAIQHELVDLRKPLEETSAAKQLARNWGRTGLGGFLSLCLLYSTKTTATRINLDDGKGRSSMGLEAITSETTTMTNIVETIREHCPGCRCSELDLHNRNPEAPTSETKTANASPRLRPEVPPLQITPHKVSQTSIDETFFTAVEGGPSIDSGNTFLPLWEAMGPGAYPFPTPSLPSPPQQPSTFPERTREQYTRQRCSSPNTTRPRPQTPIRQKPRAQQLDSPRGAEHTSTPSTTRSWLGEERPPPNRQPTTGVSVDLGLGQSPDGSSKIKISQIYCQNMKIFNITINNSDRE